MTWWASALIWVGLTVLLLVVLAWFTWSLLQKFLNTMDALGDLGDQVEAASPEGEQARSTHFVPAIFGDRADLAAMVERRRADRAERRQKSRDRRVKRGKLL